MPWASDPVTKTMVRRNPTNRRRQRPHWDARQQPDKGDNTSKSIIKCGDEFKEKIPARKRVSDQIWEGVGPVKVGYAAIDVPPEKPGCANVRI